MGLFKLSWETEKKLIIRGCSAPYVFPAKKKINLIIFHLQFQKVTIKYKKCLKCKFYLFVASFRVLKVDYRKYRKIAKFLADTLSFAYFTQINILESNISSSVLKIEKKMQKIIIKKTRQSRNLATVPDCFILVFIFGHFFTFSSKSLRLIMN